MSIERDDRWVTDALGNALAGAQVFYCTQPADTSIIPPSPLATVYSDSGGTPTTNPVVTDGFGHSVAYLDNSVLYTVVVNHPLFLEPVVLADQVVNGPGSGGSTYVPFAGTPQGAIDGSNKTFILTNNGTPLTVLPVVLFFEFNGLVLKAGLGFSGPTLVGGVATVVLSQAPQPASGSIPADSLNNQGWTQA